MAVAPQTSLPQWAINALIWCCLAVSSIFLGCFGWFLKTQILRVKKLEENQSLFATAVSVKALELQMAPMISRNEFMAHIKQMREESDDKFEQLRDDRQRMHQENLDNNKRLQDALAASSEIVRGDIRGIHGRIDDVFKAI